MNKIYSHLGLEYCVKMKTSLPPEVEEGNVEYKLKIKPLDDRRRKHLTSQLLWRLTEYGECRYMVGVDDDGIIEGIFLDELEESIAVLKHMTEDVGAEIVSEHRERITKRRPYLFASELLIKPKLAAEVPSNSSYVKIAFVGPSGAGKSSLISLLSSGADPTILDNGNGSARLSSLRHRHELLSGHTSSLSISYLPWTPDLSDGSACQQWKPLPLSPVNPLSPLTLAHRTELLNVRRLSQFVDLPGDPKFQKVSLSSLCSWSSPDWVVVQLDYCPTAVANATFPTFSLKDTFALIAGLEFSLFVVVNKTDLATSSIDLMEYELMVKDCFTEVKRSLFQVCDTEYQSRWYKKREMMSTLRRQKMEASLRTDLDPLPCMEHRVDDAFIDDDGDDSVDSDKTLKTATKLALQGPLSTQSTTHPSSLSLFKVSCVSGDGIGNMMRHFSRLKSRRPLRLLNHLSTLLDCLVEGIFVVETTQLLSCEEQWVIGGSVLDGRIDLESVGGCSSDGGINDDDGIDKSTNSTKKAYIGPCGDGSWLEIPTISGMEVMGMVGRGQASTGRMITLSIPPSALLTPTKGMLLLMAGVDPPKLDRIDSFNADVSLSITCSSSGGGGGETQVDPFDKDSLTKIKELFENSSWTPLALKGTIYMMGRRWVCTLNTLQSLYLSSRMDASFTISMEDGPLDSILHLPIPGSRIVFIPSSSNFRLQGNVK